MTTNNHPAHGPVLLDRLHQISEILRKAAAQSDGGNLGYAMADAVKVIDGAIAAFGAEPVLYAAEETLAYAKMGELHLKCLSQPMGDAVIPLYTTPPAPVSVPDDVMAAMQKVARIRLDLNDFDGDRRGIADCLGDAEEALIEVVNHRAAMLQAGKFREIPNSSTNNCREISETSTKCWCHTCRPVKMSDMRFVVCPECGNKRCPRANDHRNACTGSNELGQEGSAYPAAPQQEDN